MTWYFDPDVDTMDVYDHTGSLVASDIPISGWDDDFPDEVLEVIDTEAVDAYQANDVKRVLQCLRHGAFELIEEGTP